MLPVFAIASNITTSIGLDTATVWESVINGHTGIRKHEDTNLSPIPFWASRIGANGWATINAGTAIHKDLSPFERMVLYSAHRALERCMVPINLQKTVLILATTKGNIERLHEVHDERNLLTTSAGIISGLLNIPAKPVVVSHACVSGVTAMLYGMRLLQGNRYNHALVVGADRFTRFVLSGFQSFQAVADEPCRPFDATRKGINLGEAAATVLLSTDTANKPLAKLCSGATTNDANHISGPSRTGTELCIAISRALRAAGISATAINAISAHGTATLYNDEMEAKAFACAGLLHAHVHSLKGYIGHTLGAAGILESIMAIESLCQQQLIPSLGYKERGVSEPLDITMNADRVKLDYILKTAAGFGGCNAAAIWGRA